LIHLSERIDLIEEEKINHGWLAGRRAKMGGNMGWMDGGMG
jgi:hypothetical protein